MSLSNDMYMLSQKIEETNASMITQPYLIEFDLTRVGDVYHYMLYIPRTENSPPMTHEFATVAEAIALLEQIQGGV